MDEDAIDGGARVVACGAAAVVSSLSDISVDGVQVIPLADRALPSSRLAEVTFWVPPFPPLDYDECSAVVAEMRNLAVVQLVTAGTDPWAALLPRSVQLCSGRGLHGASTAELAVTLLLAHIRSLPRFMEQQRAHTWLHVPTAELAGSQVLVIGAGDIGSHVARMVSTFGAEVTLVGRQARSGIRAFSDVAALLPTSEAVILAVPATSETDGLVDEKFLAALPAGAVVVNVSRGSVIVTAALIAELRKGRLRAALDVADQEPLPSSDELWSCPNLIVTPHVGGGTDGWRGRAAALVRAQVQALLDAKPLANVVPR